MMSLVKRRRRSRSIVLSEGILMDRLTSLLNPTTPGRG